MLFPILPLTSVGTSVGTIHLARLAGLTRPARPAHSARLAHRACPSRNAQIILTLGAMAVSAVPVMAQQATVGPPASLNEVIVTANRTTTRIDETLADVTVIDQGST